MISTKVRAGTFQCMDVNTGPRFLTVEEQVEINRFKRLGIIDDQGNVLKTDAEIKLLLSDESAGYGNWQPNSLSEK